MQVKLQQNNKSTSELLDPNTPDPMHYTTKFGLKLIPNGFMIETDCLDETKVIWTNRINKERQEPNYADTLKWGSELQLWDLSYNLLI